MAATWRWSRRLAVALATLSYGVLALPPLVIDTDMNVDDMAAIAFLLMHHHNILAITVSAVGFSAQWAGVDNALRLLHFYNRSDIPVAFQDGYLGQTQLNLQHPSGLPPKEWLEGSNEYFTKWVSIPKSAKPAAWQSASQLIVEVLKASEEEVHFLELGPYTNLAAAMHRDGAAARKIRRLYAEGGRLKVQGATGSLRGNRVFPWDVQNKPQTASWNVFLDAIAAAQVYSYGFPTTLFADNACDVLVVDPADVDRTFGSQPLAELENQCSGRQLLGEIMLNWAESHGQEWSSLKYWDQATAVILMDLISDKSPSICEQWLPTNLTVSLQNDETYATFEQGQYGAATDACVVSSRERFLKSFYASNC